MLVISRKRGESIVIGNDITLTVVEVRDDKIRLGVVCPSEVPVHRQEIFDLLDSTEHRKRTPPPSPEEQAFLQTIFECPDDEGIRLIFADWLEEHDDPRGEFIRVQCQLAHLPDHDARRPALLQREQVLWAKHAQAWRAHLPFILWSASFKRGFVESVALPISTFLDNAPAIFAAAPVRRLSVLPGLSYRPAMPIVALAASPYLTRLAEIDLTRYGLSDHEAVVLAASPHVAGLRALVLCSNEIGSAGAIALAGSPHLANLALLDVSHNPLGEEGEQLLRARFGTRVRMGDADPVE